MHQYVYPAVFYKENDSYTVIFPDLDIFTDGDCIEKAFLFAKEYLRVYCTYAAKYDIDIPLPSTYVEVKEKNNKEEQIVMLIDTIIPNKNPKI